jgi:hypothetical protein
MRPRSLAHVRLLLGGLAASGVLAAHALADLLAQPHHHHSVAVTSHGNWTLLAAGTLGVTVAGLVRLAVANIWSPRGSVPPSSALFAVAVVRLVPLQVLGCIGLRAMERWAVGDHIGTVLTEPVALIGPLLQLLVALIGAFLLVLFVKAIHLIVGRRAAPRLFARRAPRRPLSHILPPRFQVASGYGTLRGPPLFF